MNEMILPAVRAEFVSDQIASYLVSHTTPPDLLDAELRHTTERTVGVSLAQMLLSDDQAVLFEMLVRAIGATRAIEIGTFTGYSAMAIARGLSHEGTLITCDVNDEWAGIARSYWERAGLSERIDFRLGPAIETLRQLEPGETFDFAFLDADKTGYLSYYEEIVPRLRPGGLLVADNTILRGRVFEEHAPGSDEVAIREFNARVRRDDRVRCVLLAMADGVLFAQKQ
jgi:caffeoyl-CoA O-methyltransferase